MKYFGTKLDKYMPNGYYLMYVNYTHPWVGITEPCNEPEVWRKQILFLKVCDGYFTTLGERGHTNSKMPRATPARNLGHYAFVLDDDEVQRHIIMEFI